LSDAGLDTAIIDAGPQHKDLSAVLREAKEYDPFLIIVATASPTIMTDLAWFLPAIKETLPDCFTCAIGIHVSAFPEETLRQFPALDSVIRGEPELTAKDLGVCLYSNTGLHTISGLGFRDAGGEIVINPDRGFVSDVDQLGFPEWNKISISDYLLPIYKRPFLMIWFSRGCPFHCTYCAAHAYSGRKLRKRKISNIIEEIQYNISIGVSDFLFWNEHMTVDRAYLMEFLDAVIENNLHTTIRWVCNSRVDSVDQEMLDRMHQAGCWQIAFGFDFGTDEALRLVRKGGRASVAEGKVAAAMAAKAGIVVDGHFMFGYPGETTAMMEETIRYACSLPLTFAHFYATVPFPGSELYEMALEKDWINEKDWSGLTQEASVIRTESMPPEIVNQFIRRAYMRFYGNPLQWIRILKISGNFSEVLQVFAKGLLYTRSIITRQL
jgi:radical SAM superfamily enzyme YgiQ (UPF0313 family)